jgi:hypothetical protein
MNVIDILFFLAESKQQANAGLPITQFKMADIQTRDTGPVQVKDDKWH